MKSRVRLNWEKQRSHQTEHAPDSGRDWLRRARDLRIRRQRALKRAMRDRRFTVH